MSDLQEKAKDAFYAWERANNEQDLSDRDRWLWTSGWVDANKGIEIVQTFSHKVQNENHS